jgi:hypothetical protein
MSMHTPPAPITPAEVARHWPFLERHLLFDRWEGGRRIMAILADLQNESGGAPVKLARKRLRDEFGYRGDGDAGAALKILAGLERRRVVARNRGSGRRPDAWTFQPLDQWRAMPWRFNGVKVEIAVGSCRCRARIGVAAQIPGHRRAYPRMQRVFWLSESDHLFWPGLLSVDMRGSRDRGAATAIPRASQVVDMRGYREENEPSQAPPTVLPVVLEELLLSTEGAAERHVRFREMIDKRAVPGQRVIEGLVPDQTLMRLATELTDDEAT